VHLNVVLLPEQDL